jgi:chemotaxis protein MotB
MSPYRDNKKDDNRGRLSTQSGEDAWLLTYSDVITLLLAFFVVLIAVSRVDLNLFEQLKEGLRSEISRTERVETPLAEIKKDLDRLLAEEKERGVVDITLDREGIKIFFFSNYFYNSGEAEMLDRGRAIVDKVRNAIDKIGFYQFNIDIEGHTDDVPISTARFPSNWELSVSRASNVVKYFIDHGIDADRLKASGYADTQPLVPNRDSLGNPIPENREKNRRIELRIYY